MRWEVFKEKNCTGTSFYVKFGSILDPTLANSVIKNISLKEIPLGTGEPLKEAKYMIEYENDKHVRTSTGGHLKIKRSSETKMINKYK